MDKVFLNHREQYKKKISEVGQTVVKLQNTAFYEQDRTYMMDIGQTVDQLVD